MANGNTDTCRGGEDVHLTPCELHGLPFGLVLCHAAIPASLLFTFRHPSCNLSGHDCLPLSCRVQNELAMLISLSCPSLTLATDAADHILRCSFLPGLDGHRLAAVPLGPPELKAQSWRHLLSPANPAESC